uniref:CID domain-containing protein n=1 Tax=Romanomermis culicivorax TaxID=13658 RepID=A0A915JH71_ROMCU
AVKQRLPLLYLANDVCQRERQKKLDVFRRSFSAVLKEAMPHFRSESLRPNAERILEIWRQRTIFDTAFLDLLKNLLHEKNLPIKPPINKEKILTDFKLSKLLLDLESQTVEVQQLKRFEANLPKPPFLTQNLQQSLKDKQNGLKIQSEIDQAFGNLENYVQNLEKTILNRRKLILNLEQAEIFYETQYEEAKVVQNAYKKFGQGVELVHRELTKILSPGSQTASSSTIKPVAPRLEDAPSPSPNDDPFALGVEAVVAACKSSNSDPIDMDIEEDGNGSLTLHLSIIFIKFSGLKVSTNKSFMVSSTDFQPFLTQAV